MNRRIRIGSFFSRNQSERARLDWARQELQPLREHWNQVSVGVGLFVALCLLNNTDLASVVCVGLSAACVVKLLEAQTLEAVENVIAEDRRLHF